MTKKTQKGFTLVELSIVLVIIGLIVGGVLVGQDLIKAAQVRAVVSQVQQLDAAINTFRAKYDGLPGDFTRAVAFNLGGANGDGDGKISDSDGGDVTTFEAEVQEFWHQLSDANLVAGSYDGGGTTLGEDYPENKLKKGGIVVFSNAASSLNFYGLGIGTNGVTYTTGFTPAEAFGIDAKLDDGSPATGIVFVRSAVAGTLGTPTTPTAGAAGSANCINSALTPTEFNVSTEANLCPLDVRVSG